MHTLSVWLTDTRYPHYFVNNCNLLDNSFNVGRAVSKLMSVNEGNLPTWFVNNYIARCANRCPDNVTRLFSDAGTSWKLQNAVSGIIRWRLNTSLYDSWRAVDFAEFIVPAHDLPVGFTQLTVRTCAHFMNQLAKIDKRLSVYFSAVALLHVACKMTRNGFSDKLR